MTDQFELYLQREDPARNMHRFYALSIRRSLFNEVEVVRRWGRIGEQGQQRTHVCASAPEAISLFLHLARRKRARLYRPQSVTEKSSMR